MKSRFNLFDTPKDIFEHADTIEIKLIKLTKGFGIEFKISGGYLPDLEDEVDEDDSDSGGTCRQQQPEQPDAAELADDLLRRFVAANGGGK